MNTAPIVSKVWSFCTISIPSFFNDSQNSHYSGGAGGWSPFLERTTHPAADAAPLRGGDREGSMTTQPQDGRGIRHTANQRLRPFSE